MKYNWDKCLYNIRDWGYTFTETTSTMKIWNRNNEQVEYKCAIDREEYQVGDFVFCTRNNCLACIVEVEQDCYNVIGYNFVTLSNGKYVYKNASFIDKNYPIVELSPSQLNEWIDRAIFTKPILDIGYTIFKDRYGVEIQLPKCCECGKEIDLYTSNVQIDEHDNLLCTECFSKNYIFCTRCGKVFKKLVYKDKEKLCSSCRKREYVLPYHQFAPPLVFCGGKDDGSNLFLGLELEVDGGGERDNIVKQIMQLTNPKDKQFLYCMHDGSLVNGLELITQPATLQYHTSFKGQYTKLFEFLLSKGYLAHDTDTCGIHIHFNRSYFKDNEELYISRLLYLIDKFWEEIVKFSRRNQRRIDRYTKKLDRPIKTYIDQSNKSENHDYHYYAVNLANRNTIEFRMFKGSLNIDTLMATLQFVNNCVNCAKTKTAEEIQQMSFEDLIVGKACVKYWQQRKNRINTEE